MPQEELDLLQLASRSMAEPSTGPSQIVWRQLRHADALGGFLHNVRNQAPGSLIVSPNLGLHLIYAF
jgi:hypothetical protein